MPRLFWIGAVAAVLMATSPATAARRVCSAHAKSHVYHDRHGVRHHCTIRPRRSLRYRQRYHGHDYRLPGRPHRMPDAVS